MAKSMFPSFGLSEIFAGAYDKLQDSPSSFFDQEDTTAVKSGFSRNESKKPSLSDDWMMEHTDFLHSTSCPEVKPTAFPLASLDLLNSYSKPYNMPINNKLNDMDDLTIQDNQRLSTEEILRLAGESFIQYFTNKADGFSTLIHPYASPISSMLSLDQARDIELVQLLLGAAENTGNRKFDVANKLISHCLCLASDSGTSVQRLSYYFANALQEKIHKGCENVNGMMKDKKKHEPSKRDKGLVLGTDHVFLTSHQELPFPQMLQFAGIQAILENLEESGRDKIHLIDLQIRSGIQWTALMQGLIEYRNIKHVKITAIGIVGQKYVEETGARLMSFAKSLNLPFSFEGVYVNDMQDFREDILNIADDETVVVYSSIMLRSMLSNPKGLEGLMRKIARIKPDIFVVIEVEANHNSPSFGGRFIESLFFYAAFFECLEDCMAGDEKSRMVIECEYFGEAISNIVVSESEDRVIRSVKIDVWRVFFERFGMKEIELSESSRYQASLVLKKFKHGGSYTLEENEKGLVVGWKGTPLLSLTVWKFSYGST